MCRINKESNNKTIITILTNTQKDDAVYYAEMDLKYQLKVKSSGIPIIGKRGIVNAT